MKTWIEPVAVDVPDALRELLGGHPLIAATLARRGITTLDSARAFLNPDYYQPASASELPDMPRAVERVRAALRMGELICVWGDFDVDGQTATSLLVSALSDLGGQVTYYIPSRQGEGHGISIAGLQTVLDGGARLLLTCDTGVAAHEAVDYARSRGVDMVITDHHNLPPTLPDAYAVVNPKRLSEGHPLRELPGVGCAYKLAETLYAEEGRAGEETALLDLAALGIVADVAVQVNDTRYLLQRGLEVLRRAERPGLRAMMELAELDPARLSEEHIGFVLAPRLNALGRLEDARPAVELLTTRDVERARVLAAMLERLNTERKLLSEQMHVAALAQIERDPTLLDSAVLILSNPHWHMGILGIVAARLVEQFNRPVILLSAPDDGIARGSVRSVDGIDISAALEANHDLLITFGGHTMAAGLSVETARIPELRRALSRTVKAMGVAVDTGAQATLPISGYVALTDLTLELVQDIERLAPFGAGNPPLTLAARSLSLRDYRTVGRGDDHLLMTVEDAAGNRQKVIWWGGGGQPVPQARFDLAFVARASTYRGTLEVQVEWVDARPAEGVADLYNLAKIDVVDYRYEDERDKLRTLRGLRESVPGLQVWAEAESRPEVAGRSRALLDAGDALAIWTTPPGAPELRAALKQVSPKTVYLFGVDPGLDELEPFLKRLAGLLKYALTNKGGRASLSALAAALAHREITVRVGLDWLIARGQIRIVGDDGGELVIAAGDGKVGDDAAATNALKGLLRETTAYRSYFAGAVARQLVRI